MSQPQPPTAENLLEKLIGADATEKTMQDEEQPDAEEDLQDLWYDEEEEGEEDEEDDAEEDEEAGEGDEHDDAFGIGIITMSQHEWQNLPRATIADSEPQMWKKPYPSSLQKVLVRTPGGTYLISKGGTAKVRLYALMKQWKAIRKACRTSLETNDPESMVSFGAAPDKHPDRESESSDSSEISQHRADSKGSQVPPNDQAPPEQVRERKTDQIPAREKGKAPTGRREENPQVTPTQTEQRKIVTTNVKEKKRTAGSQMQPPTGFTVPATHNLKAKGSKAMEVDDDTPISMERIIKLASTPAEDKPFHANLKFRAENPSMRAMLRCIGTYGKTDKTSAVLRQANPRTLGYALCPLLQVADGCLHDVKLSDIFFDPESMSGRGPMTLMMHQVFMRVLKDHDLIRPPYNQEHPWVIGLLEQWQTNFTLFFVNADFTRRGDPTTYIETVLAPSLVSRFPPVVTEIQKAILDRIEYDTRYMSRLEADFSELKIPPWDMINLAGDVAKKAYLKGLKRVRGGMGGSNPNYLQQAQGRGRGSFHYQPPRGRGGQAQRRPSSAGFFKRPDVMRIMEGAPAGYETVDFNRRVTWPNAIYLANSDLCNEIRNKLRALP